MAGPRVSVSPGLSSQKVEPKRVEKKRKERKERKKGKVLSSPSERRLFCIHVQSSRSTLKRSPSPPLCIFPGGVSEPFLSAILSPSGSNRSQEKEKERERERERRAPVGFWTVSVGHFSSRYLCPRLLPCARRATLVNEHVTRLPETRTRHRFPPISWQPSSSINA